MADFVVGIGRVSQGEYWVEDVSSGVQVGWVNRDDGDGHWYILDDDYVRQGGPYRTLKEARAQAGNVLRGEFGVGSPAN